VKKIRPYEVEGRYRLPHLPELVAVSSRGGLDNLDGTIDLFEAVEGEKLTEEGTHEQIIAGFQGEEIQHLLCCMGDIVIHRDNHVKNSFCTIKFSSNFSLCLESLSLLKPPLET